MPPTLKKPCKNNSAYTYSGKESSPLGLGYAADSERVGHIMEGRDKTMWMIGMKNGMKVWNRVPSELAKEAPVINDDDVAQGADEEAEIPPAPKKAAAPKKTAAAKKKAEEIAEDLNEKFDAVEEPKAAPKVAPKKPKAAPKAKAAAVQEQEPEIQADAPADAIDEIEEPEIKLPVPKKKAAPKKKTASETDNESVKSDGNKKEKVVRKPTDFNIFMKYRLKTMGAEHPDMNHKAKFAATAGEWKTLTAEAKADILAKAKAE